MLIRVWLYPFFAPCLSLSHRGQNRKQQGSRELKERRNESPADAKWLIDFNTKFKIRSDIYFQSTVILFFV